MQNTTSSLPRSRSHSGHVCLPFLGHNAIRCACTRVCTCTHTRARARTAHVIFLGAQKEETELGSG